MKRKEKSVPEKRGGSVKHLLTPYQQHEAERILHFKRREAFGSVLTDLRKLASHIKYDPAGLSKGGHQIYVRDEVLVVCCKSCGDKELGFMLPKQDLPVYIKMLKAILTHGEQILSGSTLY